MLVGRALEHGLKQVHVKNVFGIGKVLGHLLFNRPALLAPQLLSVKDILHPQSLHPQRHFQMLRGQREEILRQHLLRVGVEIASQPGRHVGQLVRRQAGAAAEHHVLGSVRGAGEPRRAFVGAYHVIHHRRHHRRERIAHDDHPQPVLKSRASYIGLRRGRQGRRRQDHGCEYQERPPQRPQGGLNDHIEYANRPPALRPARTRRIHLNLVAGTPRRLDFARLAAILYGVKLAANNAARAPRHAAAPAPPSARSRQPLPGSLRACLKNGSGKGLRARRGRWRGSPRTRAALLCSDSTKAHIREKSGTEEQQLVRRSFGEGGSQRPCPAARPAETVFRHALRICVNLCASVASAFVIKSRRRTPDRACLPPLDHCPVRVFRLFRGQPPSR